MTTNTMAGWIGGLVLGAAIGWLAAAAGAVDGGGDEAADADDAALTRPWEDVSRLEKELRGARRQGRATARDLAIARQDIDDARAAVAAPASGGEGAPPPETGSDPAWRSRVAAYPAFAKEAHGGALKGIDWVSVGTNISSMRPVFVELAKTLGQGDNPSPEVAGKLQEYNGPLITAALTLERAGVPGSGRSGAFTDPAFMVNAMAATLEAHGMPLNEEQQGTLDRIGADHLRRDDLRRSGYEDSVLELTKVCDEADLKGAFFDAAFDVLTSAQAEALSPESIRGRRSADLFNEALVWVGRGGSRSFADRSELATEMGDQVVRLFRLEGDLHEATRDLVAQWSANVPQALLDTPLDPLSRRGMMVGEHIVASARQFVSLLEALLQDLDLDEATAARIRSFGKTPVIYGPPGDGGQ